MVDFRKDSRHAQFPKAGDSMKFADEHLEIPGYQD
jgi:hypothetical protein